MLRLQNGYFSSASTDARNMATSSKEVPRRFMRAKSQKPTPSSVTITFRGVKSPSTAELGKDFLLRASTLRAPPRMTLIDVSSSPSRRQLSHNFSRLERRPLPSKGSGRSELAL